MRRLNSGAEPVVGAGFGPRPGAGHGPGESPGEGGWPSPGLYRADVPTSMARPGAPRSSCLVGGCLAGQVGAAVLPRAVDAPADGSVECAAGSLPSRRFPWPNPSAPFPPANRSRTTGHHVWSRYRCPSWAPAGAAPAAAVVVRVAVPASAAGPAADTYDLSSVDPAVPPTPFQRDSTGPAPFSGGPTEHRGPGRADPGRVCSLSGGCRAVGIRQVCRAVGIRQRGVGLWGVGSRGRGRQAWPAAGQRRVSTPSTRSISRLSFPSPRVVGLPEITTRRC